MTLKFIEDSRSLILNIEKVDIVNGTDRMLSLGNGVRAKLGKTKEGKTVIKEYLFDRDRYSTDQAEKWFSENQDSIKSSLEKVQENAPLGSFSDITARVMASLNASPDMPKDSDGFRPWLIEWVFPDHVIMSMEGKYYRVNYTENDRGQFTFSQPKEVDMTFVAKEGNKMNDDLDRRNSDDISDSIHLNIIEKGTDQEKQECIVVLIEAGANFSKKRYYPERTLRESATKFAGLKMYLDHPTDREEIEKPERSIKDWLATIEESWFEDGKILGRVHVHAKWLWENLKDETFRKNIGISINASGRMSYGTIDGVKMQIVETIVIPKSVDWVTEPGARGRVLQLIESAKEKYEKEDDLKMLKTITIEQLREGRPDLVTSIEEGARQGNVIKEKDSKIQELETENKNLKEKISAKDQEEKKSIMKSKVSEIIEGSKLPQVAKETLVSRFESVSFESEDSMKQIVEKAVKDELAYLTKIGGVKPGDNHENATIQESVSTGLAKRCGIEEEKK